MLDYLVTWLRDLGLHGWALHSVAATVGAIAIALLACAVNLFVRKLLLRLIKLAARRTRASWDDALIARRVFHRLSHLAPALVIYWLTPLVFPEHPQFISAVLRLTEIYMIVAGLAVLGALLNAADDIYAAFDVAKRVPIKGFLQVIKIAVYCIGGIAALAVMLDKTPLYLLSGLGAMTAVLLIVFKDAILGFTAGAQLTANHMVSIGDWIEMPSHNADGDVIEVALTTVKVRNWDKTITTIPTYDLISRPFKNWRGMQESGGRRIKRAVAIDVNTIRLCDDELLGRLERIQLLREHLAQKRREIAETNRLQGVDEGSPVNGRRLTNVGTFRAYIEAYLRHHPQIHQQMTFLVRHLEPGPNGLPIELYVFTTTTEWAVYEAIQADIFDHILAVAPQFDLRIFQTPSGADFRLGLQPHSVSAGSDSAARPDRP